MIIPAPSLDSLLILGFNVKFYAIIFLLSFFLIYSILYRDIKRLTVLNITKSQFTDLSVVVFISAILGARFYHVLTSYELYYSDGVFDYLGALNFRNGGLGVPGGIVGGLIGGLIYSRITKIADYNSILSLGLPTLLLGQSLGRLGNYFNQELFGRPSSGLLRLEVDPLYRPIGSFQNVYYQPLFLYEGVLTLLAFLFYRFLLARRSTTISKRAWVGASYYFTAYGLIRAVLEPLRIDPAYNFAGMRLNWWVSILFIITGLTLFMLNITKKQS